MTLISSKALVVGGGRGIGREICLELARRGADIALLYRADDAAAAQTCRLVEAEGRKAAAFACDITDAAAVAKTLATVTETFGAFGILVQAAGATAAWKSVAELEPKAWADFIAVDLNGAFNVLHAALPTLRATGGAVVALSSIAASLFTARNAQTAASKAGLEALIRVVAREEGRHGVRANVVALGLTESPSTDEALASWGPETAAKVIAAIPLKRIGQPADVARMAAFLLSDEAAYITGKVFTVDGGQHIGH
ncbi:MAG: fabG4 [Caulobacter sp.]|nr:fabG4 [Caulobacter sp.]